MMWGLVYITHHGMQMTQVWARKARHKHLLQGRKEGRKEGEEKGNQAVTQQASRLKKHRMPSLTE
jgi:flagellar biosynthesis/type III secretory pathway protein FliH